MQKTDVEGCLKKSETKATEAKFAAHREWYIPRRSFILFALPKEEHAKLKAWRLRNDPLTIDACSDGEVLILNDAKLSKQAQRKLKNKEMSLVQITNTKTAC